MNYRFSIIPLVLGTIFLASLALYNTVGYTQCSSLSCFQEKMSRCALASYVNEEPQASWEYQINGRTSEGCAIQVTLLQAKEGDLELRKYEGHKMICTYPKGTIAFPDKDMSRCHGQLKEDLQDIIIKKLHQYVLDNLGDIASGLI